MLGHHIRHASRALSSRPGFAATAIIILTIGIGATPTILSLVDAVILKPLPFSHPDQLVVVWETSPEITLPHMFASPPNYADWTARSHSFSSTGAFGAQEFPIAAGGEPGGVPGARVSASLLTTLGVAAALERLQTSPGIVAAGAIDASPFVNDRQETGFALDGESLAVPARRVTRTSAPGGACCQPRPVGLAVRHWWQ